ncbi:hypothetical protein C8Q76DRAFT_803608 [Earliella scabrosa]|nr:hypothetical protein C8Q76DRAFT_803608 [Earliella scabrosa]
MELAVLYDNATSEDLDKLHKVALVLIDVGKELIAALSESMCHLKQDATPPPNFATIAKSKGRHSSYFYWCPEDSPRLHLFDIRVQHGKQQTLPGSNHCSGFLSSLHVHVGHKVTGQREQQVQCYAQAISNVFLHPAFQFIFYGILEFHLIALVLRLLSSLLPHVFLHIHHSFHNLYLNQLRLVHLSIIHSLHNLSLNIKHSSIVHAKHGPL